MRKLSKEKVAALFLASIAQRLTRIGEIAIAVLIARIAAVAIGI